MADASPRDADDTEGRGPGFTGRCWTKGHGGLRDGHCPLLPRLKTQINIPGHFWIGTLPADRSKLFAVEVAEVEESHVFTTENPKVSERRSR